MSADPLSFVVTAEEVTCGWRVRVDREDGTLPVEAWASSAHLAFGVAASAMTAMASQDPLEEAFRLPPAPDGPRGGGDG